MADDLVLGDVVLLVGHGIEMTVVDDSAVSAGIFGCAWYDNNNVLQVYDFRKDVLKKVENAIDDKLGILDWTGEGLSERLLIEIGKINENSQRNSKEDSSATR